MGEKSFEFLVLSFELGRWGRRYLIAVREVEWDPLSPP